MMDTRIYNVKSADHYTDDEIKALLDLATDQYSYDYLIDRLYFIGDGNTRNKPTTDSIPVLTVRSYLRRRKREMLNYDILDDNNYK